MDIQQLTKQELARFIVENPQLLEKMEEPDLLKIQERMNPYAQVVDSSSKFAVLSITNFKAEHWRAFKALSLLKFMNYVAGESKDWAESAGVPPEEYEAFNRHIETFRKFFLVYDSSKDCRDSKHNSDSDVQTPAADFFHRWQRYEDQNASAIHKDLLSAYNYRSKHQAAVQVYDVFNTEEEAQEFVKRNSATVGVDLLIGQTNKWLIIQDNEQFLDKTLFADDEDRLLTGLLEQMRKDAKIGEDMIKKRVETKKKESEAVNGKVPDEAREFIAPKNRIYANNRLEMAEIPEGQSVSVPLIMTGPEEIAKHIL